MQRDLTTAEVAARLDCTFRYVSQLIRAGELAGEKRGRDWFVAVAELEKFLRNRKEVANGNSHAARRFPA